jgi:glycosyltransferase involved in cell wall biosynthesis
MNANVPPPPGTPAADINLFLETLFTKLYPLAPVQAFIPNQEWFFMDNVPRLAGVELVICKSHHAAEIFSQLGKRTAYASFTSRDRWRARDAPMQRTFLCLGAKQGFADRVAAIWKRHPVWPALTIVTAPDAHAVRAKNIRQIRRYLPDDVMAQLQNEHQFHVCVSRAEGFGHKLNEGLSCGAIVLATDGPPMNELIRPEHGMLVRAAHREPLGAGSAFYFDEADFERTVEGCLQLSDDEIERLSLAARRRFEENDDLFRDRFPAIVRSLVAGDQT